MLQTSFPSLTSTALPSPAIFSDHQQPSSSSQKTSFTNLHPSSSSQKTPLTNLYPPDAQKISYAHLFLQVYTSLIVADPIKFSNSLSPFLLVSLFYSNFGPFPFCVSSLFHQGCALYHMPSLLFTCLTFYHMFQLLFTCPAYFHMPCNFITCFLFSSHPFIYLCLVPLCI